MTTEQAAEAFRGGLRRGIDDEQAAGRLGDTEAVVLRQAVALLPVEQLLGQVFGSGEGG